MLCALAVLVFAARGEPVVALPGSGGVLGLACGAAALTRQPAVLLIVCARCRSALDRAAPGGRLPPPRRDRDRCCSPGPWWGYAYHRWHNPFQSNLAPRASLMLGEPAGVVLLLCAARSRSSSTRTGPISAMRCCRSCTPSSGATGSAASTTGRTRPGSRRSRPRPRACSASSATRSRSAGLVVLALPALVRVLRRRERAAADVGLGVLGLLAVVALAAFVVMLIRFPQRYGDPIKSSYLLFTTPCWAIFSVAAWSRLRQHHRRVNLLLVAVAALYAASYAADLGDALAQPSGTPRRRRGRVRRSPGVDPADLAEPRSRREHRLPRRRRERRQPDRRQRRAHGRPPGRDAAPRAPVLRTRLGLHRHPDDRLPARLPRRRLLDPHPLLGAGDGCRAPDDRRPP